MGTAKVKFLKPKQFFIDRWPSIDIILLSGLTLPYVLQAVGQ